MHSMPMFHGLGMMQVGWTVGSKTRDVKTHI